MTCAIRRLNAADASIMADVNTLFGEAFQDSETYGARRPSRSYLEGLLARDDVIALAASSGPEVVGALVAYVLPKFEQERSEVYIYDLAVAAAQRRRGLATAMIDELRRISAERDAYVIFVQADYGDDPAVRLYSKFGMREDVMHFDIEVPGAA